MGSEESTNIRVENEKKSVSIYIGGDRNNPKVKIHYTDDETYNKQLRIVIGGKERYFVNTNDSDIVSAAQHIGSAADSNTIDTAVAEMSMQAINVIKEIIAGKVAIDSINRSTIEKQPESVDITVRCVEAPAHSRGRDNRGACK